MLYHNGCYLKPFPLTSCSLLSQICIPLFEETHILVISPVKVFFSQAAQCGAEEITLLGEWLKNNILKKKI